MRVTLRDGHHLHVRVHGDGAPDVLLLHGWVVSSEVWQPVIDRWPAHGAGRLLAVDLRGAGMSSKPAACYALEDYAGDVSRLLDALELRRILLVGHGLGGLIAQRVAIDRPEVVARLALLCSFPASGVPTDQERAAFLHSLGGSPEGVRQVITRLIVGDAQREALERVVLTATGTSDAAFHESFDAGRTASFADALSGIKVPTVVVAGDSDAAIPPFFLRKTVAERIPGASFVELPKCGHYPQLEAPDLLTKLLREQAAATT